MVDFPAYEMPEVMHAISGGTREIATGAETGVWRPLIGSYVSAPVDSYQRTFQTFPPGVNRSAAGALFFSDDFYNRVHFLPPILSLGNLTRDEQYLIEIFNAYLENVNITAITPENNLNIVGGGLELPALIKALRSVNYNIAVSMDGPGTIDATFNFIFDIGDVYGLKVIGNRLVVFAFPPDWSDKVVETLSFFTDILEARDGTEQRIIMRNRPRYSVKYSILESNINLFDSYMAGWGARTFVLPLWWRKAQLLAPVNQGESTIVCDSVDHGVKPGEIVLIWRSPTECEAVPAVVVSANSITIEGELNASYGSGYVVPTRLCVIAGASAEMETIHSRLFKADMEFEIIKPEDWPDAYVPEDSYQGLPVIPYIHDYSSPRPRSFEWRMIENDTGLGLKYKKYLEDSPTDAMEIEDVLLPTHAETDRFKTFLMSRRGPAKAFYVLIKEEHFELVKDIDVNTDVMFVKNNSYFILEHAVETRKTMFLKTNYGRLYIFKPESFAMDFNGDMIVNIDSTWDASLPVNKIRYIGFAFKARFDQEDFDIEHTLDVLSRVSYRLKGVKQ
jgi:hypothetical protein